MFLLNVWKTVSSATVPLVPFLVWVIKTKQDELKGRKKKIISP